MRKFIFSILTLIALPTVAQTFYEVNFVDPDDDDEEYTGLMIYYDDTHCKMRIINDEMLNEDAVAETNYVQTVVDKQGKKDVGMMTYAPEDEGFPTFIWAWEKEDASDISENPFFTFKPTKAKTYHEVNYFTEISLSDMDEEYIAQFYSEDEPEYKMLMRGMQQLKLNGVHKIESTQATATNTVTVTTPPPAPASGVRPTFRLLLVANTEVNDIGVACARDLSNLRGEFSAISRVLGMEYDEHIVAANDYNKLNVAKMVKGINAGPNDVLMFVYSGHGFRFDDQTDYYPNIDMRITNYDNPQTNYIAMTDVYKELQKKGARLTIVLSDCCNTKVGIESPMTNMNSLFSRANVNFDMTKLQSLFLGSSGMVRATASSPGEVSWCGVNGGFFLLSFLESLRSQISPLNTANPTWEALISNSIDLARSKSSSNANTKAQNGLQQVQTKAVNINSPAPQTEDDGNNVPPGEGGSTLDF